MYEYKKLVHGTDDFPWETDIIEKLNYMNLLGWELVSVSDNKYYFKKLL